MAKAICYWRGSAEIREDIISALGARGYGVKQLRTLEEMLDFATKNPEAVILVDGSASQREAATRIVELANTEKLYRFPVFFVSALAAKRCATLKATFTQLTPIDIPYNLQAVVRAMQIIVDPEGAKKAIAADSTATASTEVPGSAQEEPEAVASILESIAHEGGPGEPASPASASAATTPASEMPFGSGTRVKVSPPEEKPSVADSGSGRRVVEDNSKQNRERLKKNPDPANLQKTYGGEVFSIATDITDFRDDVLIPERPSRQKVVEALDAMSKAERWSAVHARRVAFVASALGNAHKVGSERDESIRLASLLFNWGFLDSPKSMKMDLFRPVDPSAKAAMIQGIESSATFARERFNAPRASQVLLAAASILKGEHAPAGSEDLHRDAELTLLVELSDRCCWSTGHWQPFGAYRAIRFLRGDQSPFRSPDILHSMSRVIGEAVTTHVTVGNVFVSYTDPGDGAETHRTVKASSAAADVPESKMKTVQIADLKTGMRLAKPVVAKDGRVILEARVRLDDNLLYQLWQLATIRALGSEISIIT